MTNAHQIFIQNTIALWVIVVIYWVINSRTGPADHKGKELFSFIKLIGSSLIIYAPLLTNGLIATPLFITSPISDIISLIFSITGISTMILARHYLGKNWSGNVILQKEHTITKIGPYKFVRHPIYSGGLLAMLGSAIVVGQIFGFAWVVFSTIGLIRKIKLEEGLLSSQFPEEYPYYKKKTKMLVPFLW